MFRIPPIAEEGNIFEEWHVCYHGTKASDLCDIFANCGRLLKPGTIILYDSVVQIYRNYMCMNDCMASDIIMTGELNIKIGCSYTILRVNLILIGDIHPNGSLREPGPGRWTEETAPEGHNVNQYFFSPTPAYSEMYSDEIR